jgi:hypothetical protein
MAPATRAHILKAVMTSEDLKGLVSRWELNDDTRQRGKLGIIRRDAASIIQHLEGSAHHPESMDGVVEGGDIILILILLLLVLLILVLILVLLILLILLVRGDIFPWGKTLELSKLVAAHGTRVLLILLTEPADGTSKVVRMTARGRVDARRGGDLTKADRALHLRWLL